MKGKALLILGGAGLVYLATRAKTIKETIEFLEYEPRQVEIKFEGLVPVVLIKLVVINRNRSSVPITGFVGRLLYKGSAFANVNNTERININGDDSTIVTLKVRLSLFNTVVSLFTKDPNKVIAVEGLIKTPVIDVPVKFSYNFITKAFSRSFSLVGRTPFHSRIMARAKQRKVSRRNFLDVFRLQKNHLAA